MISVLPNGGEPGVEWAGAACELHSMISVLPNGGVLCFRAKIIILVALDDISATEWRMIVDEAVRPVCFSCTR